jgi:diguanylate cyclase (GGDEF)-like protein
MATPDVTDGPQRADELAETPTPLRSAVARERQAAHRDDSARRRDLAARARDQAAQARDQVTARRAAVPGGARDGREQLLALRRSMGQLRSWATEDRALAAADREQAASDRAHAAADRRQARIDLARAHLDDLTGAYTRGLGEATLCREIDRAHRTGDPFVLAFVDVDGLKDLNDRDGHAAGDEFLREVVHDLRHLVRSYDPIVRIGGDEFLCGLTGSEPAGAMQRVADLVALLATSHPQTTISVGLTALEPGDTLEDMTSRGDAACFRVKREKR